METLLAHDSPRFKPSLICCSPRSTDNISITASSSSTSGCVSADESYETTLIPKSLLEKNLKVLETASVAEVQEAIARCKELIWNCPQCSEERKWIVRYLVELRFRLEELKDENLSPVRLGISLKGHHFKHQIVGVSNRKQYCDHCSGVIWSIVQSSYQCTDCGYLCHYKCIDNICRICAHIIITEKGNFEMKICPEIGLAAQDYKCAECQTNLNFKGGWNEPRLCDYTGLYFCATCHWNDLSSTPARVIHNWDWEKRPVSRLAKQLISIAYDRPLIDIEKINDKLFNFIADLEWVRKMRNDLVWMRKYLCACDSGSQLLTPLIGDTTNRYSMAQLEGVFDGTLVSQLTELTEKCRSHITNCALCSGKGYLCEVCGNNEILYPFDSGAMRCPNCNSLYHRSCWLRKNQHCSKCLRIESRKKNKTSEGTEELCDTFFEYDIDKWVQ